MQSLEQKKKILLKADVNSLPTERSTHTLKGTRVHGEEGQAVLSLMTPCYLGLLPSPVAMDVPLRAQPRSKGTACSRCPEGGACTCLLHLGISESSSDLGE